MAINKKENYSIIAPFYDRLMNSEKYKQWQEMIKELVEKYSIPKNKALEIGCGTGRISKILSDLGFKVSGIDISSSMLEVARGRYPEIDFIKQDVLDLSFSRQFDFAVSLYDSLNYLLEYKDLKKALNNIASSIKKNGIFFFDIVTKDHVVNRQKAKEEVYNIDGKQVTFSFSGKGDILETEIGIAEDKEIHEQRGYNKEEIKEKVIGPGFDILDIKEEKRKNNIGEEYMDRLFFVLKRGTIEHNGEKNEAR
mgnify:CR=1 FL=1